MKRKKGILLVIVLLLSTVLFLFAASYLSSVANNAAVVSVCSEREAAFIAANAGLDEASNKLSDALSKTDFDKLLSSPPASLKLETAWKKCSGGSKAELESEYRYRIDLENKVIYSQGRALVRNKSGREYVKKQIKSVFLPEYLGIASRNITVPTGNFAGVKSIYSYITQLPLESWIETEQHPGKSKKLKKEERDSMAGLYYSGAVRNMNGGILWGNSDPIRPFLKYNSDNLVSDAGFLLRRLDAINVVEKLDKELGFCFYSPKSNQLDNNSFSCYEMSKKKISPSIYGAAVINVDDTMIEPVACSIPSEYGTHVAALADGANYPERLFKDIRPAMFAAGGLDGASTYGNNGNGGSGGTSGTSSGSTYIPVGDPTFAYGIHMFNTPPSADTDYSSDSDELFSADSGTGRKVFYYKNKRVCIVMPFNRILIIKGDLYLDNSIIYTTGNLCVKGSIRGSGVVVSANSIALYPSNVSYNISYKGSKKKINAFEPSDRLLIYADNNVFLSNNPSGGGLDEKEAFMYAERPYYSSVRDSERNGKIKFLEDALIEGPNLR